MLKLGRGRAYLLVKDHYDPAFRDPILYASLHNLVYEWIFEGSRATYMLQIIEATDDFAFYRNATLQALVDLSPDDEEHDIMQVFDLAGYMADDGDDEMREAINHKFLSNPALGLFAGAREIIALDGEDGFVFVAETLSEQMRQNGPDFKVGAHVYRVDMNGFWWLENSLGQDRIDDFFQELRAERPSVAPVLDAIDEWRESKSSKKRRRKTKPERRLSYAELKQNIENPTISNFGVGYCRSWAKSATDADLLQAAHDLLAEADPERQTNYLALFWERPFPLEPDRIFGFMQKEHRHLTLRAIDALVQMNHPAVRAMALAAIERGWMVGQMVDLLRGVNYRESDWAGLIEPLTQTMDDPDDHHDLGMSVGHIVRQHPTPLAIPSLLNLFQYGPCAFCRAFFVDDIGALTTLPDWLHEEARYDSNEDVWKAVRKMDKLSRGK